MLLFQDWNEEDPLQRAMLKANENRYDLSSLKKSHKRINEEDFSTDNLSYSREKKSKTKEATSTVEVRVKVEPSPEVIKFNEKMRVLKAGKGPVVHVLSHYISAEPVVTFFFCLYSFTGQLQKLLGEAQDLASNLCAKGEADAGSEIRVKTGVLSVFLERLRNVCARGDSVNKDAMPEEFFHDAEIMISDGLAHKEGTMQTIRDGKAKMRQSDRSKAG